MIILDTHALVWWAAEPTRLSLKARRAAQRAAAAGQLAVSAMSLFEIATLLRRGRLQLGVQADRWLEALRTLPEIMIEPVSAEIACVAGAYPAEFPGDPADRIIAATAHVLGAKLLTADGKLQATANVETLW